MGREVPVGGALAAPGSQPESGFTAPKTRTGFVGPRRIPAQIPPSVRSVTGADGSVTVSRRVAPGGYLCGCVLGWGGLAAIEKPGEAKDLVAKRLAQLEELYAS